MSSLSFLRSKNAALLVLTCLTTAAPIGISAPAMAENLNQAASTPSLSRTASSPYIVQVSPANNQPINNSSISQTINNNLNTQATDYRVPQGTRINVEFRASDKIVITPGETRSLTLIVTQDILNSKREILIPKDSQIDGQIVPRYNGSSLLGSQFVAQRLLVGNQSYNTLNATSLLFNQQSTASQGGLQQALGGAAVNTAAQVLLGRVTGQSGNNNGILGQAANVAGGILGQSGNNGGILGQIGNLGGILGQSGNNGGLLGQAGNVAGILGNVLTNQGSNQQQQNGQISIDSKQDLQLTVGSDFYVNTSTKAPNYSIKTY
ncbi:MAG: hypothetical protein U7123_26625 [Potamolinea sp.]